MPMKYGGAATQGYDCTHSNLPATEAAHPDALLAGYSTAVGTFIGWTPQEFAEHPNAVRIDQHGNGEDDFTADYLDLEPGAGTTEMVGQWAKNAMGNYLSVTRAGQRWPSVYMSASNVTAVADALKAAGVDFPVGLVIAEWGINEDLARHLIATANGPYPIVGFQYLFPNGSPYGYNFWAASWLAHTAKVNHGQKRPPQKEPSGQARGLIIIDYDKPVGQKLSIEGTKGTWVQGTEQELEEFQGTFDKNGNWKIAGISNDTKPLG